MNQTNGSYQFDRFVPTIQNREIERLNYQSQVLHDLDLQIWQKAGLEPTMRVLDLGCGTGKISLEMARFLNGGSLVGVDRSPAMVAAAETRAREEEIKNATFYLGSSDRLEFTEATFDCVCARLLFQHLSDSQPTLREIFRVLKPGGIACLTDVDGSLAMFHPELESMAAFRQAMVRAQQEQGGDPFVGRKLGSYLAGAGFQQVTGSIEIVSSELLQESCGNRFLAFLDLLSFGAAFHDRHPELVNLGAKAKSDAAELVNLPYVWGGFGLFVATGIKP